jgi:hypothetical protein
LRRGNLFNDEDCGRKPSEDGRRALDLGICVLENGRKVFADNLKPSTIFGDIPTTVGALPTMVADTSYFIDLFGHWEMVDFDHGI